VITNEGCESKDLILYTGDSQSIEGGSLVIPKWDGKEYHGREWIDYGSKSVTGTTRDREKA
jgi:hypothetical protein